MSQDRSAVCVDIFTQFHRYSGQVETRGYRLTDVLNDPAVVGLDLRNVRVTDPACGANDPLQCAELLLKKESVILAIPQGSYEAPSRRLYQYVAKKRFVATIILPGYRMIGTLHLPSRAEPCQFLSQGGLIPSYIPITDATVQWGASKESSLRAAAVILRRHVIESLFVSEQPTAVPAQSDQVECFDPNNPKNWIWKLGDSAPAQELVASQTPLLLRLAIDESSQAAEMA